MSTGSYTQQAKQRRQDKFLKWPAGEYTALFKGATLTTGRNSPFNKMINLEMAPVVAPPGGEEDVNKLKLKNKKIVHRFVFSDKGNGFEDFLVFLEDLGADLSKCRPEAEDPDYTDLLAIMQELEYTPPQLKIEIKWPEDGRQYYNVYFRDIPKVFGQGATAAPAAPGAPAPAAPAPAAEVIFYQDATGVVVSNTREHVQELVNNGFNGQVNINSKAWTTLINAGFVMPVVEAPAPLAAAAEVAAPAAPAAPEAFTVDPADNTIPAETAAALGQTQAADAAPAAEESAAPAPPAAPAAENATAPGAPENPFA